jgi:sec-independent protein translocase protein TatB
MFEVGFTEIILILGLALLVLGPEKLPGLAEKIGRWTGRARSMARQLRTQLEQEVTIEQMTKSKPMQAMDRSPSATDAGAQEWSPGPPEETPEASTTPPEAPPPSGFDLDQHLADVDTSPEAMHGTQKDKVET